MINLALFFMTSSFLRAAAASLPYACRLPMAVGRTLIDGAVRFEKI